MKEAKKNKVFKKKASGNKKFQKNKLLTGRAKGYDVEWTRYRFRFLHYNPNCYMCGEKATIVDHVVAHKGDDVLFKALDNHIPLCKKHHDQITAMYDRGEKPRTEDKMKWIQRIREELGIRTKVKRLPYYSKGV